MWKFNSGQQESNDITFIHKPINKKLICADIFELDRFYAEFEDTLDKNMFLFLQTNIG